MLLLLLEIVEIRKVLDKVRSSYVWRQVSHVNRVVLWFGILIVHLFLKHPEEPVAENKASDEHNPRHELPERD